MTTYDRGDVVLVGFTFSDESGRKLRPAVVVSSRGYNRARQETIVAAITSNIQRRLFGDHPIGDWKEAGLLFPSIVTAIVRTIKRAMINRKIGALTTPDLEAVDRGLRRSLNL
jgi:mRNA interferase MazF